MDAIGMLVTALAGGAAAGLKPVAETAIKDAYQRLKGLLCSKFPHVSVDTLEVDATSKMRQGVVKEELEKTSAASDSELLEAASRLLEAIRTHAPEAMAAIGVSLEDISGAALRISDVTATGAGVAVKRAQMSGDIEIKGVRAGAGDKGTNP
jgi:hypothetical protein